MIRVRICTSRCRCQSSCRRSRFSGFGTQILGKRFSSGNFNKSRASKRSVFCFRPHFLLISAASPIHTSILNSASNRSNQRENPWPPSPRAGLLLAAQSFLLCSNRTFSFCSDDVGLGPCRVSRIGVDCNRGDRRVAATGKCVPAFSETLLSSADEEGTAFL